MTKITITEATEKDIEAFEALPIAVSCRLIGFDNAEVVSGIVNGTHFLFVSGMKPYVQMQVSLNPRIYIRQPEYWGIEVVGCLSGFGSPAFTPYVVELPISNFFGTKGIEVIGANGSEKISVS